MMATVSPAASTGSRMPAAPASSRWRFPLMETSFQPADTAEYSADVPAPTLILASRSPRRRQLLAEFGFAAHESQHPGFDDAVLTPNAANPAAWVMSLAYLKAWARATDPAAVGRVILGADTACLLDGNLIGTPTTPAEARAMLKSFMGRDHHVLTGVAVIDHRGSQPTRHLFYDTATVRLGRLTPTQIQDHLAGESWQGKAGGYNYREAVAMSWPIAHTGDATTIMGLPMQRLSIRLASMGLPPDRTSPVTHITSPTPQRVPA